MTGVLNEIAKAQKELAEAQHRTISEYLSLQVLLDGSGLSSLDEAGKLGDKQRGLHWPSAWINLATTLLYLMNYYIVGPTSAEYAAALGGSPAASGLIVGMTPIAACFSCLLYSWWTNTSFRQPLLFSTGLLVVGNLLYGMALSSDAFWMVLLGRTLIGLGGARGVSRRYIADTIPVESRTAYSAAFVAAGSVGMAVGPFISAMLTKVDFTIVGVRFNGLTNPGWVMFVLWVVVGFLLFTVFQASGSHAYAFGAHDTPEDTHIQAPGSSRSGAIWSTRTSAADASGLVSNNSNNNHKFELSGGGGMYGSTDGARVEHLTESGAAPTNTMDGAAAYIFGWSISKVGYMMSVLGLVVLPVNAAVGQLSKLYEDRALLQALAAFAALGCLVAVDFSWMPFDYTEWQYMAGVGIAFVAMQAHEGVVMSITTKVIPEELARGTWNSGFLATEAGTFGRFVGDALITAMGVITLSSLNILLFMSSMILVWLMILAFMRVYPFLQGE
ncbi:unnamed protein product [Ascophyllum nodosum]